jgi:transposase InsO family protein
MKTPAGSVILWVTSAGTTLPRSMPEVSQSFFSLLQKNVLDRRTWATREELRIAIVAWIERTYHRRRRQAALGRLTPVEYELIMKPAAAQAA